MRIDGMDAELKSDTVPASGETSGESQFGASSASEKAVASGEHKIAVPPNDGQAKPVLAQFASSGPTASNSLADALTALDRRDYATASRLFAALGRRDAAEAIDNALAALDRKDFETAQGLFEALASAKPTAPGGARPGSDSWEAAGHRSVISLHGTAPLADAAPKHRAPRPEGPKRRGVRRALVGTGLAVLAIVGAYAAGVRLSAALPDVKSQALAGLASAADLIKTPFRAIAGATGREEELSAMRDLSGALTQATIRLEQFEHEYRARLDKLEQRIDQGSSTAAQPVSDGADVAARLDRLEKAVAAAPAPPPAPADVTVRLDKLERTAAVAAQPASELADLAARLDRLEKKVAVQAATSIKTVPLPAPKPSTLAARAEPSASNDNGKPDNAKPLLREYIVEGVQDGFAVVESRYGAQQVAPGDFIPGAGRVLRIEKRGGAWVVLTSRGVIASGAASFP